MSSSIDAFSSYLESYRAHMQDEPAARVNPFITLSRQAGAGGITITEEISRLFNEDYKHVFPCTWTSFDRDLIKAVMEKYNLSEECAKYLEETTRPQLQDILEEILGVHPSTVGLVRNTSQTILQLAQMGYATLVGRGANVLTRNLKGGFHVRIIGSLKKRVPHLAEYLKVDEKEAEQMIKKDDEGRKKYMDHYFAKKINDPLIYDLVINTDKVGYHEAAQLIVERILARHKTKCYP